MIGKTKHLELNESRMFYWLSRKMCLNYVLDLSHSQLPLILWSVASHSLPHTPSQAPCPPLPSTLKRPQPWLVQVFCLLSAWTWVTPCVCREVLTGPTSHGLQSSWEPLPSAVHCFPRLFSLLLSEAAVPHLFPHAFGIPSLVPHAYLMILFSFTMII